MACFNMLCRAGVLSNLVTMLGGEFLLGITFGGGGGWREWSGHTPNMSALLYEYDSNMYGAPYSEDSILARVHYDRGQLCTPGQTQLTE